MDWFERLTGFPEESHAQVHQYLLHQDRQITSQINGRTLTCGDLEIPTLGDLRQRVQQAATTPGRTQLREVVGDVQDLHAAPENQHAIFQVASQFNLLEMVGPAITPEQGIGRYETDPTQGPACAVAAGAGTIYRNYFVPLEGGIGQTADRQVDCLADLGQALGNQNEGLWRMQNGYAIATQSGLQDLSHRLEAMTDPERDELRSHLRIGIQWNTEVTYADAQHLVTQVYCSALPVAYSQVSPQLWKNFAMLVLEAAYEATLCVGVLNALNVGHRTIYLTLLGGGAFGNDEDWIHQAILRALHQFQDHALDVAIVSYGRSKETVQGLIQQFNAL